MAASGLTTGLARAAQTGEPAAVGRLIGAAVSYVPAIWVLAGVAVTLFGLVPRVAAASAWTAVGVVLLVTMFAESFDWPAWVSDLSPVHWVPTLPLEEWAAAPLAGLLAVAAALIVLGFAGFRRRDLAAG
jgi:ABC-2 type transport system permease protein